MIWAAVSARRIPGAAESLIAREVDVIVYVNETVSAGDINIFIDKFQEIPPFFFKDFKTSLQALEELKKDRVIAAELDSIDREFSPPHTFILGIRRVDPAAISSAFPRINRMENVEFVDIPLEEIFAASSFLNRLGLFSNILTLIFCAAAMLLIYFGSLFYYYFFSEIIDAVSDLGAPFIKMVSPGVVRQFFAGILCALAASFLFYFGSLLSAVPVFSIQAVLVSALLAAALSPSFFILICVISLKKR